MTHDAKLMCGITILTIPSIQYRGYFLLRLLSGDHGRLALSDFQRVMFRAGHAHAGVLVILTLICQLITDEVSLPSFLTWTVRGGMPSAALLISGGFFFSAMGKDVSKPGPLISLLYVGTIILAISLILLGVGLLR